MGAVAILANLLAIIYAVDVTTSAAIKAREDPSKPPSNYLKTTTNLQVFPYRVNKVESGSVSFGQTHLDNGEHRRGGFINAVFDSFLGGDTGKYQDEVHQGDVLPRLLDTDTTPIKFIGEGDSSNSDLPSPVRNVPPYMMDLYNTFGKYRHVHPNAEIIRSFRNQGSTDRERSSGFGSVSSWERWIRHGIPSDHCLVFNITMPSRETVVMGQLRIYILVANSNTHYGGIARVIVYRDLEVDTKLVASRVVYRQTNGWETFDLTRVVRLIVRQSKKISKNSSDVGFVQSQSLHLRVHVQPLMQLDGKAHLDVDISQVIEFEPLLVVYSDNFESLRHAGYPNEQELVVASDRIKTDQVGLRLGRTGNLHSATTVRGRRDATMHHRLCKRRPLHVVFKDIGWDKWVVAPMHYQAFKCSGKCLFPLTEPWNPTVHSIIQSLAHEFDPLGVDNPCCVPTQLAPISMLYLDQNNVLTYKYRYEGMVVRKCGCR